MNILLQRVKLLAIALHVMLLMSCDSLTGIEEIPYDIRIKTWALATPDGISTWAGGDVVVVRARDFSDQTDSLHWTIKFEGRGPRYSGKVDGTTWSEIILPPVPPFTVCVSAIGRKALYNNGISKQ